MLMYAAVILCVRSGVATGWTGVDMYTPFLLEVAPEIDTNPTSFYTAGHRGVGSAPDPRYYHPLLRQHAATQ